MFKIIQTKEMVLFLIDRILIIEALIRAILQIHLWYLKFNHHQHCILKKLQGDVQIMTLIRIYPMKGIIENLTIRAIIILAIQEVI